MKTLLGRLIVLILLLIGLAPVARAQLPGGTVAYYSFENTLADGSGTGNHLAVTSGSTNYATGHSGNALYLDGTTTLGTASGVFPQGVPIGAAPYTVAAWIKADTGCPPGGGWIGYGNNDTSQGNNFRLNGSATTNGVWEYWYGNDFGATLPTGNFLDGFHSVVGTWDGTNEILYLDGVATVRNPPPTGLNVGTNFFYVGRTTADVNFKGWIDEMLIVNRALTPPEVAAYAGTTNNIVTTTNDSGPGSLRQVVSQAYAGATITFTNTLSGSTILLTTGWIPLHKNLTIDGSALTNQIQINGSRNSRIFFIQNGATLLLNALTLTNGFDSFGGAIYHESGTLTISNSTLTGNSSALGGAVYSVSSLTVSHCAFIGNTSTSEAGAVRSVNSAFNADNCTFVGNCAAGFGGACSIADGGPAAQLNHLTVVGNISTNSGGGGFFFPNKLATLNNSIVASNISLGGAGPDIYTRADSTLTSSGVNLLGNTNDSRLVAGPTVLVGSAQLAPLNNYGGPTRTMPPLFGSPAINVCTNGTSFATDQRGLPRIISAFADIGAVEVQINTTTNSLVVTTTSDILTDNPANGVSLRSAVFYAADNATITFATNLSAQTILLTNASGQIKMSKNVTIDGSALTGGIQINGNHNSRIIECAAGTTNTLTALTLTNGYASGIFPANVGGALFVYGNATLTISNCALSGNSSFAGGGIFNNSGTLRLNNSTLANNSAALGGGIFSHTNSTVTLNNSTLANNSADFYGGGIYNDVNSTVTLNNSTLANNSATYLGGGIDNSGTLTLNNSTLANNSANSGGGIENGDTLNLTNSIVSANPAGDVSGISYSGINNLVGVADINLAPLANYGGPTMTMPPLPGSPAIDAGSDSAASQFTTDQRGSGFARKIGAQVDIGAVESGNAIPGYTYGTVVNTNADFFPNGFETNIVSLRSAVAFATNGATITFSNPLSGATILLTNGSLVLIKSFNIDASALTKGIAINGNHTSRIFECASGTTNTLMALTLTNGYASGDSPVDYGGALLVNGNATLTVYNCTLTGNSSDFNGGGIYSYGTLTLNNSTLANNSASSAFYGGGIYISDGTVTVNNSTLANNSSAFGGGIFNNVSSTVTINNSTLANNSANYGGGGILNGGTVTVNNSTLANNSASGGGGIYNASTMLNLTNSIVSANSGGDVSGNSYSGINNLVGVANINLAPLANYGGPTMTMPPLPGSPAVDAGSDAAASQFTTDQRGFPRFVGAHVDIGAVEGVFVANYAGPGPLKNAKLLGNGAFQFGFTNYTDMSLTVWASTNVALPLNLWSNLGAPVESPAGTFTFTDPQATNSALRFYRVTSP